MRAAAFSFRIPDRFRQIASFQVAGTGDDPLAYLRQCEWEFAAVASVLPRHPRRVLDLGCGLGRTSVYLGACLPGEPIHFVLADTSAHTGDGPKAGWDPGDDFYNDLEWTAEFVRDNGVTRFETFDILRDDWSRLRDIDLVLSFLAVGFHFPIEGAIPHLLEATTADCTMIFGARAGRYSRWSFRDRFRDVRVLRGEPGHPSYRKEHFLILRGRRDRVAPLGLRALWRLLDRAAAGSYRAAAAVSRRARRLLGPFIRP
jgi:SAM-dependent methyltransferase